MTDIATIRAHPIIFVTEQLQLAKLKSPRTPLNLPDIPAGSEYTYPLPSGEGHNER
jgi:hypothetical protein